MPSLKKAKKTVAGSKEPAVKKIVEAPSFQNMKSSQQASQEESLQEELKNLKEQLGSYQVLSNDIQFRNSILVSLESLSVSIKNLVEQSEYQSHQLYEIVKSLKEEEEEDIDDIVLPSEEED